MHRKTSVWLILHFLVIFVNGWRPCPELSPALRFPCRCNIEPFGPNGQLGAVAMNCDRVVFQGDTPPLPQGAPIVSYQQRFSGQQVLPAQLFALLNLPLKKIDYSNNAIRRLPEKMFLGVEEVLLELRLADNFLGDSLNPIFSTAEFRTLENLRILDLSGNKIKGIEDGIFKGCSQLQELYLNRNSFLMVPTSSLNGPTGLRLFSLTHNNLAIIKSESFSTQTSLEKIDLSYNHISNIEGGAFYGLNKIKEIYLGSNRLARMNSDVFLGVNNLHKLDLSQNFFTVFPIIALKEVEHLKSLNISANMIQNIDASYLSSIKELEILDLSRNGLTAVLPATFRELKSLKFLDLSLNSLRTIEDDALEGLDSLQTLIIRDNNILLIPGSALGRLPRLSYLYLDYNRVAALSSDILGSIKPEEVKYLSLSRNVIRELPSASFQSFTNLNFLDLSGNSLATITSEIFIGLENSLLDLRLSQNRITGLGSSPLALKQLRRLDLSENSIVDLTKVTFSELNNLGFLNLSGNTHFGPVPPQLLQPLSKLRTIDMSNCDLKTIPIELFASSQNMETIILKNNGLQEILDGTFSDIKNLSSVDLSNNNIITIRPSSFVNCMNIRKLILKGNQLSAFKGEFFNTGTGLEELDISDNQLSYLFPSSFRIHPRLKSIKAANNQFNFFPSELIAALQYLEFVDLSSNQLKTIDELDFARLPRLRTLLIRNNLLESISEMAFHNSTQLQIIDLSENKLERIGDRTFEGLLRIESLNLEGNKLTELPETLFERNKLQMLESINLARNNFEMPPLNALQRQYFFLTSINLSQNMIRHMPKDDSLLVNIKNFDLSFNPLTPESIRNILSEPKTIRVLNLSGTNIKEITPLETPFLKVLNLSMNQIGEINEKVFERASLLESIDLSSNQLKDLKPLSKIWPMLISLNVLDLSNNSFEFIAQGDFDNLDMLKTLNINNLNKCSRLEKNAFKNLPNLAHLSAYEYPRLGYLDVQGITQSLPGLESLDIEIKDAAVGSDQIQLSSHPRLRELGIRGYRLRSISTATLAGLKSNDISIKLVNTSISALPPALFFPVPRSSKVSIDITGSMIPVLSPQLLSTFEDRRNSLTIKGLTSNPIHCDCNARALRRWLPSSNMIDLRCFSPENLQGKLIIEVGDDELTCDPKKMTSTTTKPSLTTQIASKSTSRLTTIEPEIIWSLAPAQSPTKIKTKSPIMKQPAMTNDDTLIIGIVGGVVAFIAILIIVICIVRLRMNSSQYRGGPMAMGIPPIPMPPSSVQVSYKGGPPSSAIYGVPQYAQYATLPHKISQSQQNISQIPPTHRTAYSTMGRIPYYHQHQTNNGQPFYIYADEKAYK